MSACPDPRELDRWLREAVDPTVAAHVEGCETCRLRVQMLRTSQLARLENPFAHEEPTVQAVAYPGNELTDTADLRRTQLKLSAPPPPPPSGVHEPGDTIGRFVVLQRIGEGGMGVVYSAYDPELDRKVAIKLMRSDVQAQRSEDLRNRLLREAQAMARLSHPNVIPVYDVGMVDGQVFIAMEFVDGKTLSAHLRATPGWRAAVALHVQAGKGLAAAHAAGLIHRDFKPQNVLVTKDSQVRVLDFGLARPSGTTEPPAAAVPDLLPVPSGSRSPSGKPLLNTPLTQSDIVLGTPAYMSPEQFDAGAVDARTDQFALCVSLFEALYGVRPFEGETVYQLVQAIRDGRLTPAPRGTKVPSRLYRILKRGLAAEPSARFPSIDALLTELQRDPAATTRRVLAAVTVTLFAAAGVAATVWSSQKQRQVCKGAESKLHGAWDADRKDALLRAFIGTGVPYAPQVFATATTLLDAYTQAWVQMRTDACEATRLRGEQSEQLLDLRIQCLDRKLQDVGALLDLFASPDAKVVDRAVPAVQALGALRECADQRALGLSEPDLSPGARKDLDAAYTKLAEAKAVSSAAEPTKALELARDASSLAAKSGQLAAVAESRLVVADLRGRLADDRGAEEELVAAVIAGDSAKRDDLRARALTELSLAVFREGRPTEALSWGQLANAALARAGGDDAVQARLHHILALVFHQLGRPEEAQAHFGKCLDLRKKAFGADSYVAAAAMQAFGKTLHEEGKLDEAVTHLRNAVALQARALGEKHPDVALAHQALGSALAAKGEWKEAESEQRAAIDGLSRDALLLGAAHADLARTLLGAGRKTEALAEQQLALTTYVGALPARHPSVAQAWADVAALQLDAGDKKAALISARKATALVDVESSPPGLAAKAVLTEARAMLAGAAAQKKPAQAKAQAAYLKLVPRAPKDPAVRALGEWALQPK